MTRIRQLFTIPNVLPFPIPLPPLLSMVRVAQRIERGIRHHQPGHGGPDEDPDASRVTHVSRVNIIRPVLVVNVFLVTRPHAILEAACFGHYLALRMLSSITTINVTILSVVCLGNVQIV